MEELNKLEFTPVSQSVSQSVNSNPVELVVDKDLRINGSAYCSLESTLELFFEDIVSGTAYKCYYNREQSIGTLSPDISIIESLNYTYINNYMEDFSISLNIPATNICLEVFGDNGNKWEFNLSDKKGYKQILSCPINTEYDNAFSFIKNMSLEKKGIKIRFRYEELSIPSVPQDAKILESILTGGRDIDSFDACDYGYIKTSKYTIGEFNPPISEIEYFAYHSPGLGDAEATKGYAKIKLNKPTESSFKIIAESGEEEIFNCYMPEVSSDGIYTYDVKKFAKLLRHSEKQSVKFKFINL